MTVYATLSTITVEQFLGHSSSLEGRAPWTTNFVLMPMYWQITASWHLKKKTDLIQLNLVFGEFLQINLPTGN